MDEEVKIRILRLPHARDLPLPERATEGSSGCDLRAAVEAPVVLEPGRRALIPTGLRMEIPAGWEGQVRPRSGLAARYGVTLVNAPGTVDSDYRGEVRVPLINLGEESFVVSRGDRVAQLVFGRVARAVIEEVDEIGETDRGADGFGSSGL